MGLVDRRNARVGEVYVQHIMTTPWIQQTGAYQKTGRGYIPVCIVSTARKPDGADVWGTRVFSDNCTGIWESENYDSKESEMKTHLDDWGRRRRVPEEHKRITERIVSDVMAGKGTFAYLRP